MNDYDKEIEEAFYKHQNSHFAKYLRENFENVGVKWDKSSFIAGAKWQQQKDAERIAFLQRELNEIADLLLTSSFYEENGNLIFPPNEGMWVKAVGVRLRKYKSKNQARD